MIAQKNHWKHRWVLLAVGLCLLVSLVTLIRFQYVEAKAEPLVQAVAEELAVEPEDSVATEESVVKPEDATENDPDAIPNRTARELLEYVNQLWRRNMFVPNNDAERIAHVEKLERMLKAVNMGLDRVINDELNVQLDEMQQALESKNIVPDLQLRETPRKDVRMELLKNKSSLLLYLDDYVKGYTTMYLDFLAELEANPEDHEVAKISRGRYLEKIGGDFRV